MNTASLIPLMLLGAGLFAGCQSANQPAPSAQPLRAGAAEVDITPPIGYRMAGYFNERVSTGIHDPLHAKAIVLQQGPEQVALVSCDLVGLPLNVTTNARALASAQTGIPVSHIVICATHSHTGPLFEGPLREYFHEGRPGQTRIRSARASGLFGFPHRTVGEGHRGRPG